MKIEKRINQLINQINSELKKKFKEKLDKIILFGSYARGEYDSESDIDLLVLIDDEEPKKYNDEIVDFDMDFWGQATSRSCKYRFEQSQGALESSRTLLNKNDLRGSLFSGHYFGNRARISKFGY